MTASLTRRTVTGAILAAPFAAHAAPDRRVPITAAGARADGTVVTRAIQATIDRLAGQGGGTVVVPAGVFVSGALFFKPGVHLHLEQGAVLRCSTDMANFSPRRTRIEGHFEEHFTPALVNASECHGFRLSGPGVLDGDGHDVWELFWKLRRAARDPGNFRNIGIPRARLALIERSKGVVVDGVTFRNSQFWNLHLYDCDGVAVRNARFEVPDDYKQAPSTDGIDLDSCRRVSVENCFFSVTDDCIALKGSKGPHADQDRDSPPVEGIRVRGCTFKRGGGVLTLGSEATLVRDVVVEDCRITGPVRVATLKLRGDTPQHYEDIHFRGIRSEATAGPILSVQPWTQYFDLKGETPPRSVVRNVTLDGVRGHFAAFGTIKPNPGQTTISDVVLRDFDVTLGQPALAATGVERLRYDHVTVNGRPVTA
jgi:alpha-L-rhamnosidase